MQVRTREDKNILHAWQMLYEHRHKVQWDETLVTLLSLAIFRDKSSAKLTELMQVLFQACNLQYPVNAEDTQAVVDGLAKAPAIPSTWLPVAVSWLVYEQRVQAALDLFANKSSNYSGDLAARTLVTLSKLSQESGLPAAVPVLFECVEYMLDRPEFQVTATSMHALVQTCEFLQNYPLAG